MKRTRVAPSATGDKIRAYARAYAAAGQKEHAQGMIQAADTVDVDLAGTSTGLVDDPLVSALLSVTQAITRATEQLTEAVADMRAITADAGSLRVIPVQHAARGRVQSEKASQGVVPSKAAVKSRSEVVEKVELGPGPRRILIAVAQHKDGCTRQQISVLTQYKTSTRNTYIRDLCSQGFVTDTGWIRVTAAGQAELGPDFKPLPTGAALVEVLRTKLPEGEWLILSHLLDRAPLTRHEIDDKTGYKVSTRNTYIRKLQKRELVYTEGDLVYPDEQLIGG
jgi:hypothetical protein